MSARLGKLFQSFGKQGIDGLLVSSWPNVTYLSGFKGTESWIFVSPKGLYFITDSRYSEQAKEEAPGFKVILREQPVTKIVADLVRKLKLKKIGFESSIVTHSFYKALEKNVGADFIKPVDGLVELLRIIKDRSEIEKLRKSADIAVKGFHYTRQTVRPGMTEREVQGRLEYYTKSIGSEKPAFELIIAAGPRASMPHCMSNETKIKDMLLVDMGCVWEGYHSDLTRPLFLGRMTPLQKKVNGIVWDAQRAGIRKAGPGVKAGEVDAACRNFIRKKGYAKYFGHGTGHGVGLEIHEDPGVGPRSETVLKPGMVITVEPGIYLPGKFGVRIEDMVLITEKGHDVLTSGLERQN
jgi:Xaa-Pro aminopeptidase